MKTSIVIACTAAVLSLATGTANAKGCITGAAVGGVAGHIAGHHGLVGAAAGCAVNHHRNKVKDEKAAAAANQPAPSNQPAPATAPVAPR